MSKIYRKGAIGALMDEYERAAAEIMQIVNDLTEDQFERVRDLQTEDEDCRSIQTILNHVVRSGYGYANYIREVLAVKVEKYTPAPLPRLECLQQLTRMFEYTVDTLQGRWEYTDKQVQAVRIQSRWGPQYDLEQLLEHAIVHILRHRRQIERFLAG